MNTLTCARCGPKFIGFFAEIEKGKSSGMRLCITCKTKSSRKRKAKYRIGQGSPRGSAWRGNDALFLPNCLSCLLRSGTK